MLVDPELLNFGTVKPDRHQKVVGRGDDMIPYLYWCAVRGERVKASSAREIPASAMHRPIRTRRLKKADFEADFFFIGVGY